MDTPEGNSRRSWPGPRRGSGPRGTAGGTRATVLGSLVWFHLPVADQPKRTPAPAEPQAVTQAGPRPGRPDHARPTQLWAAAIQPTPA
jgi:hypothetical protein